MTKSAAVVKQGEKLLIVIAIGYGETSGFYSKIDLGIVKYHFETGAGKGDWKWA